MHDAEDICSLGLRSAGPTQRSASCACAHTLRAPFLRTCNAPLWVHLHNCAAALAGAWSSQLARWLPQLAGFEVSGLKVHRCGCYPCQPSAAPLVDHFLQARPERLPCLLAQQGRRAAPSWVCLPAQNEAQDLSRYECRPCGPPTHPPPPHPHLHPQPVQHCVGRLAAADHCRLPISGLPVSCTLPVSHLHSFLQNAATPWAAS